MPLSASLRYVLGLALIVVGAATSIGCGSKSSSEPAPSASVATAEAPAESAAPEASAAPAPSEVASAAPPPSASADPHLARQTALAEARAFGLEGLLNSGGGGDPDAPTAPFGRDDSIGSDPLSARGNMWGDSVGEAFGHGGLGLSGIGEGGGGRGEGIGLGSMGTIGHGAGTTNGGSGMGSGSGSLSGGNRRSGDVRITSRVVSGSLPEEVVQRVLRAKVSTLRTCYDAALKSDPTLSGNVPLEFVIGTSGVVESVRNPGAASEVGLCMTKALQGTSFPAPEGGPCKVSASVTLTPPAGSAAPKATTHDATPSPVADPSTSVEQIHGLTFDAVQASDVAEAMRAAGCINLVVTARVGFTVITATYKDVLLTITFAAAGSSAVVPAEEAKRLRGSAVVVERLGMFLAIEGPRSIAESLRRAIVIYGPVK